MNATFSWDFEKGYAGKIVINIYVNGHYIDYDTIYFPRTGIADPSKLIGSDGNTAIADLVSEYFDQIKPDLENFLVKEML